MGTLNSGAKNIEVAGIAERLTSSSFPARWVDVQAKFDNTNNVFIGGSTIDSMSGIALTPGATITIGNLQQWFNIDLHELWVDVAVNGEGVTFNYWSFP